MTIFSGIYLPIVIAVGIILPRWLPALLICSTSMQGASVLNVPVTGGVFGISPYNVTALACFLRLIYWLFSDVLAVPKSATHPLQVWRPVSRELRLARPLIIYAAVAFMSSFTLPYLFAGMPIQGPTDLDGYLGRRQPLGWSVFNLVQTANLCVHLIVIAYLWQAAKREQGCIERLTYGMAAGVLIAVFAGAYERIALWLSWPSLSNFWLSNPGYERVGLIDMGGAHRIGVPFSEPSFASAFFASVTTGFMALLLWTHRWRVSLLMLALSGAALVNTLGTTGLMAFGLGTALLMTVYSVECVLDWVRYRHPLPSRFFVVWLVILAVMSLVVWQSSLRSDGSSLLDLTRRITTDKLVAELSNKVGRLRSDLDALNLVWETWGLGVGLGSSRSSSLFTSLLSNVGIVGAAAWLALLCTLFLPLWRLRALKPVAAFTSVGMAAATLAMGLAIPDLNMPMYWAWIFVAFAVVLDPKTCQQEPHISSRITNDAVP